MEYKAIMETESQRQRDCHTRRMSANAEPPEQRANSRRLAAKMAHTSNDLSKAVAILTSDGTAPGDPETLAKIVAKTPTDALEFPEETLATIAEEGVEAKNRVFIDPSKVSIAILACANNSSSDIAGVSFELIKSLLGRAHSGGKNNFLSFFSFLIEEVAIFTLQHVQADKSYYTIYNITACFLVTLNFWCKRSGFATPNA